MTKDLHQSTQDLIRDIERKDRRFRIAQAVFMTGVMITLIGVIVAQFSILSTVKQQLEDDKVATELAREQRNQQLESIERRLNCMVVFFSTPDRDNLTIENIQNCTLNKDKDLNQFFQNESSNRSENPPNLTDSSPTATSENAEEQKPQNQNHEQNNSPETENQKTPIILTTPIGDIPACIPLTQICAR